MNKLLQMEWYKLRKTNILPLLLIIPLFTFIAGYAPPLFEGSSNEWYITLTYMSLSYSLLFYPLLIGVMASFLCRYEHQEGGWKQLLTLPINRTHIYLSKFTLLFLVIGSMQLLFIGTWVLVGVMKGMADPLPIVVMVQVFFGGWIAALPIAALMLWLSSMWSSFAAPLTVNVIFTLPSIMIANSETIAPYYPWVQPFFLMLPEGLGWEFTVSFLPFLIAIFGFFIVFFLGGFVYLKNKEV
ncbi:ABC transporter permease [Alkalihalobacillus pseudalcaliphilus]|uniref:ABC transporter permease n=1 Tax=Alkalihalobacillus pseudalcaliphilus TaxID=79884 RepID=UPI00064DBD1E|nr:ABC transporter permease [Alkalihalobacillus pseudalcaliphilus]KMK75493.1 hypothetical protein AB990_09335 [Alkalihalobacillus pseudalcaliphilus]